MSSTRKGDLCTGLTLGDDAEEVKTQNDYFPCALGPNHASLGSACSRSIQRLDNSGRVGPS